MNSARIDDPRVSVDGSNVSRNLKLTTLAPDIIQAILNGEEPDGLSLAMLIHSFPEDWTEQRKMYGFEPTLIDK